jgi:hypothetical protein
MPVGWAPNGEAFAAGLEIGVYVGLVALLLLVVVTGVRRVVAI